MSAASSAEVCDDTSIASLAHEIKFVMPASSAGPVEAFLGAVCRPEHERPPAWVCSVYFDTPGLTQLDEKVNSDYLKTKVRVRWYEPLLGPAGGGPAFIELKQRIGNRRDKQRYLLGDIGAAIARWPLEDPRWLTLLAPLAQRTLPGRLLPALHLRYIRSRFIDPATPARIAVDRDITALAARPGLGAGPLPARLPRAVVEWKSATPELPLHLTPLTRFGARRQSFSKYFAAMQAAVPSLNP